MKIVTKIAAAAVLLAGFGGAEASVTIDFTGVNDDTLSWKTFPTYSEDGFTLDTRSQGLIGAWGQNNTSYLGNDSILSWNSGTSIFLTRDDDGLFNANSIDIGSTYNSVQTSTINFVGTFEDDTTATLTFSSNSLLDFQTFSFGSAFENVKELSWRVTGGSSLSAGSRWAQYDNIQLGLSEAVTPGVPEPSTWLMMLLGFAMSGMAMRRRSISLAAV